MNKPKMTYFEENDVLRLAISEEDEAGGVELSPNITAELNDKGDLIGIEILLFDFLQYTGHFPPPSATTCGPSAQLKNGLADSSISLSTRQSMFETK
jgi:hypothetical protein